MNKSVNQEYNPHADDYGHDDGDKYCPECERPNQFGELCDSCRRAEQIEIEHTER